jgi:hypothetical protein
MSSYYFPFGGGQASSVQNVSHSLFTVTASVPVSSTIRALSASFAINTGSTPPNGANGTNQTAELCGPSTVSGSIGVTGPQGPTGTDLTTCPPGTIECTDLNQYLPNLNISRNRPSGSQFVKVCMQIPVGCTSLTALCPPYLPSASVTSTYPSIS